MQIRTLSLGLAVFFGCSCVTVSDPEKGAYSLRQYRDTAVELQDVILATEIIPGVRYSAELNERIRELSFSLMDAGQGIATRFVEKHPYCRPVFVAVRELKSQVSGLESEDLAKRFDVEDTAVRSKNIEKCYQVRALMVRPATIIVTLKQPIDKNSFEKLRYESKQATDLTQEIKM